MMKRRIFTLACVTAIALTTACVACSCGDNSSHAKNDGYYHEENMTDMPNTRNMLEPENEISVPHIDLPDSGNTITPPDMPEPKPYFPRLPHHRRPLRPHRPERPDCSDGENCDQSADESAQNEQSDSENDSASQSQNNRKRNPKKRRVAPKKENATELN